MFCKKYCPKTIEATNLKKYPNESKLIYAINIFIVASRFLLLSYGSNLNASANKNDSFVPVPLNRLSRDAISSCRTMRSVPNAYVLANFDIKHAMVCASKIFLRPIITLCVRPSVH